MASERSLFERRLRTVSRLSLYLSLALSLATSGLFLPFVRRSIQASIDQRWYDTDYQAHEEVELLQRYVSIDTSRNGSEIEGARFLADRLAEVGIQSTIEPLVGNEANLWALYPGEDPSPLILHNHIDVEAIFEPEKWKFDPFGGAIDSPWIYGRGVFDMKSITIAQLTALMDAKRRLDAASRRPKRSILFLATSGEEHGSELGTRWLLRNHQELFENAWAVLTEGGVLEATARDQIKYWGLSFAQKTYVDVVVCSTSRPRIDQFSIDVGEMSILGGPAHVSPEVREFLEVYADTRTDPKLRSLLSRPDRLIRDMEAFDSLPPYARALFRNEAWIWPVEWNEDLRMFTARVSLALVPGTDLGAGIAELLPEWMTHGMAVTILRRPMASRTPPDHELAGLIEQTIHRQHGDVPTGPYFLSFYANDSRYFREAGIDSFGFTPFVFMASDSLSMSGPNEHIALPEYVEGVDLYRELIARVVGLDPE